MRHIGVILYDRYIKIEDVFLLIQSSSCGKISAPRTREACADVCARVNVQGRRYIPIIERHRGFCIALQARENALQLYICICLHE